MISLHDDLPDDPVLLKQLLLEALNRQEESAQAYQTHIVDLKEQIKLLRDRLFGRKSEQTVEPNTPQLALFNEPESEPMPLVGDADEEVVASTPRRGKCKPLSADLPRVEVIHELPEHELTCACGCRSMPSAKRPVNNWTSCRCRSASSNISERSTGAGAAKQHRSRLTSLRN